MASPEKRRELGQTRSERDHGQFSLADSVQCDNERAEILIDQVLYLVDQDGGRDPARLVRMGCQQDPSHAFRESWDQLRTDKAITPPNYH